MTIKAEIICDSVNKSGNRLTTLVCTYPRFIHSETLTHRAHSRNSASSRAVPVETMIQRILDDTAMPVEWGLNRKGMQAGSTHTNSFRCEYLWLKARDKAIESARLLASEGLHKQIVNRVLEPYMHMQVVLSGTEWDNYFELRAHPDAQPEFQVLARSIKSQIRFSVPRKLKEGEWHLPFIKEDEKSLELETQKKVSVARCARVSYYLQDGSKSSINKDLELYNRLVGARPIHASPTEHQAQALSEDISCRNFRGWKQFRVEIEELLAKLLRSPIDYSPS